MSLTIEVTIPPCPKCGGEPSLNSASWHLGYIIGYGECRRIFTAYFGHVGTNIGPSHVNWRDLDSVECVQRQLDQQKARVTQHSHEHIHINDPMDLIASSPDSESDTFT